MTESRNNYVDALYNYNVSISALEQATGIPLDTPVGQGASIIANSGAIEQLAAFSDSYICKKIIIEIIYTLFTMTIASAVVIFLSLNELYYILIS